MNIYYCEECDEYIEVTPSLVEQLPVVECPECFKKVKRVLKRKTYNEDCHEDDF